MKNLFAYLVALLLLPGLALAQTTEFSDDFEGGTGNWVLEGSWGTTTTQSNSPSNSLTDSPAGNYAANTNISATLATGIDLTSALDATLTFSAIYDIEGGNFDFCYVEVSTDDVTWVPIATFLGEDNLTPWTEYSYSLGGFVGNSNVKIRFRMNSDGGVEEDGFYVDDVVITSFDQDNAAPLILHEGPEFYEGVSGSATILADLIDISGIASSTLYYSIDGAPEQTVPGVEVASPTYAYVVPGQAPGTQVDYRVEATDDSPNTNVASSTLYSYIAGNHVGYDNATVNFVNVFGPAAQSGLTACAVRVTLFNQDLAFALIRNYTDINRPNGDFTFHVWADNGGLPGDDIITPFTVTPEANLDNTSPMTRVDLRPFAAQLAGISGDVFIGFTVEQDEVWLTQTTPAVGNRTYVFNGTDWALIDDDYHFRVVVSDAIAGDDCADATDLSGLLGGEAGSTQSSAIFDNTNATPGTFPNDDSGCFDDGTLENDQWYTFTGDGNAYLIGTSDCGATDYIDFGDTQMLVYTGDDCGNLTQVACNEDTDFANDNYAASLVLDTEEGVTYYILIDGWDGSVGEYCVQFTQTISVTCDDIALGTASTDNEFVCLDETTSFILDGETIIPDNGPIRGFRWVVTSADISGSADPGSEASYLGAFGEAVEPYTPALVNDLTQLPAGDYFFTPVVYAGAEGAWPALDYSNGCVISGNSILISLLPAIDAITATNMVSAETNTDANGEISVMPVGGTGVYEYVWSNGETTSTITGLSAGDYTVTITDISGCTDPYIETITVDMEVSVTDVDFASSLNIFPNPAQDKATIRYNFTNNVDLNIEVTNAVGQVMWKQEAPNGNQAVIELDLKNYSNGIYFITFNDGLNQLTRRLVVNK